MRAPAVLRLFPLIAVMLGGSFAHADGIGIGVIKGTVTVPTRGIVQKAPECAPLYKGATGGGDATVSNIWESAKLPALNAHCAKLQLGIKSVSEGAFGPALDYANKAELDTPGQAGPWVLRGEAYSRWERFKDAAAAFEKAKSISSRALDDAETLDDYGAVLVRLGKIDEARKTYRALLPRVGGPQGLCGPRLECDAAGLAYLTAGALALEAGPTSLDEAVAILREARTKSESGKEVRRMATLALALALDRRGDVDQAKELTSEVAKTKGIPSEVPSEVAGRLPSPEEGTAMRALGLESSDPPAALEAWKSYVTAAGEKKTWVAHAKAHQLKLEKTAGKPK
jgi:Flp pilus assembly protein TadD